MKLLVRALCLVSLLSCLGSAGSYADWIENGVPLTFQFVATGGGVIASDGSSGAIIAFLACNERVSHVIAQHVDSLGAVRWGEDGIDICSATGIGNLQITSDSEGGAIIAWEDIRSGNSDIYAQRVNASGALQWTANGLAICTAGGQQGRLAIISDGVGGAIVTWEDYRSGDYDIYAQRVNASGAVLWTTDGVALCTATGDQYYPTITSDGAGGAVVAWYNYYNIMSADIYAQRVNASGAIQWIADGVAICTAAGNQDYPMIAPDGAGGAIIAWEDLRSGNYDIYAQRVNASGSVQWTNDGIALCTAEQVQATPRIVSDNAGGVIVGWNDYRSGNYDIYAQRVNASGSVQWTNDGVALCTATGTQGQPSLASDGAGGAIATWCDNRDGNYDIYAQRVNTSGTVQWTANGVALCTAAGSQARPQISADGAGGAIVTWEDARSASSHDVFSQRVSASGSVQWTTNGTAPSKATGNQEYPSIGPDGAGGAIITWEDYRSGNADIYAQKVNASGAIQWTINGKALCTKAGDQFHPTITSDGMGGAIIAWQEHSSGLGIYAQRVNASGAVQWTTNGVALCAGTPNLIYNAIVSDGAGGALIAWKDLVGLYWDGRIYAQRVNASGAVLWTANGTALCAATGDQYDPTITSDGAGGAIVTWYDDRNGNCDIYAQRVNASGAVLWTTNGTALCTATGDQGQPSLVSDGAGGAIATWYDKRNGNYDIYAQRVNASGSVQWIADGVALCTAAGTQWYPTITSDGTGGAIVTWQDGRSGSYYDIYAQRVNALGSVQWTANGVALCTAAEGQARPQISSDGAGGAIVTWQDNRNWDDDIYAQKVSASGVVQWTTDGVALCTSVEDGGYPMITFDSAGGGIIAWQDNRCIKLIYAQRVDAAGHVSPETATLLQNYSAALNGTSIHIEWALSEIDETARFSILRSSAPDWEYAKLNGAVITQDMLSFDFTDRDCLPGSTYKYRIDCEVGGTVRRVLFETEAITMPVLPLTLYQNHPNPFNPQTVIRFYLPEAHEILLDVYDVGGRHVARLAEGRTEMGYHEVMWDGRNSSGTVCSSGVYFSRLKAGKTTISRKMVIMR